MTRRRIRSRDIATGATNPRTTGDGSVTRPKLDRWAVGREEIQPGTLTQTEIGPRSVREKHLHPELLPWRVGGSGKVPFLVAASDSSDTVKAASDYVCTGTADQVTINQAITDAANTEPWNRGRIVLSEGTFYLTGTLDPAGMIEGFGGAGDGRGTSLWVLASLTGPVVTCRHAHNFDIFVGDGTASPTYTVGTILHLTDGSIHNVGVGRQVNGDIAVGVQLENLGVIDGLSVSGCTTGITTDAAAYTMANMHIRGCKFGVEILGAAVSMASCRIENVSADGIGVANVEGTLAIAAVSFQTHTSTGTVGILNEGALNAGAEASCTFDGFGTDVDGGGGSFVGADIASSTYRIPLYDETGTIVGGVGGTGGSPVLWGGDGAVPTDYDGPLLMFGTDGHVYLQNHDYSGSLLIDAAGLVEIQGTSLRFGGTAAGIDGTATPSTAAELADVLVNLGIIASHTIP